MKQKHNITALPVLLTTGLFALCAVLVLLTGAVVEILYLRYMNQTLKLLEKDP